MKPEVTETAEAAPAAGCRGSGRRRNRPRRAGRAPDAALCRSRQSGRAYANHRHNVGFMAADAIDRRHSFSPWSKKFQAQISEGRIGGEKVLLIKPQTCMNLSGQAVGEAMRFYKLELGRPHRLLRRARPRCGQGARQARRRRRRPQRHPLDRRPYRQGLPPRAHRHRPSRHQGNGDAACAGRFRQGRPRMARPAARRARRQCRASRQGRRQRLHEQAQPCACRARRSRSRGPAKAEAEPSPKPRPAAKGQSHIRQARPQAPAVKVPETGPMAAMLKRLFGKD